MRLIYTYIMRRILFFFLQNGGAYTVFKLDNTAGLDLDYLANWEQNFGVQVIKEELDRVVAELIEQVRTLNHATVLI